MEFCSVETVCFYVILTLVTWSLGILAVFSAHREGNPSENLSHVYKTLKTLAAGSLKRQPIMKRLQGVCLLVNYNYNPPASVSV